MSYPKNAEERLLKLYGFSLADLDKIYNECGKNSMAYQEKIEQIDRDLAANIKAQMANPNLFLH
jgi:glutamyl-tRNA reductase